MSHNIALERFSNLIGANHVLTNAHDTKPYTREWRDLYFGQAAAVLRPANVEQVAGVMALANEQGLKIIPQGGNTGLVGAQVPDEGGEEIILSLSRLNKIRSLDPADFTITAEAGVVLANVQEKAAEENRLFPLALGSQGSCQIGGLISTNAGGTGVLAYGNMRDLVLGLEVVLPNGEIWNGLRALRKDNTGYDLKQLFIGGEGTIGVVTAAILKLFPKPSSQSVAFIGVENPFQALALLSRAREFAGSMLTGFELMPRLGLEFSLRHLENARDPLQQPAPWYVLMEVSCGSPVCTARDVLENMLASAFEDELLLDATLAENLSQSNDFWRLRHGMSEVQKFEGGSIKHDVSVPVARIPAFLDEAICAVKQLVPGCRPIPFGHMGDGNIHFNVSQPISADKAAYLERWDEMNEVVHAIVTRLGGSISAEHGIGRLKRDLLPQVKSKTELAMMRQVKSAFDPGGILNPGRML